MATAHREGRFARSTTFRFLCRGTVAFAVASTSVAAVSEAEVEHDDFCSRTALTLFDACNAQVESDRLVAGAKCINVSGQSARQACRDERDAEESDGKQLCADQRDGRLDACALLGEARYDPPFTPDLFDDPKSPTNPNPFFPLAVGNFWEYRTGSTTKNTVEVVDETKLMPGGVRCIVVRDVVKEDGFRTEATDDWYAAAKDGTTWYCGESTREFEVVEGDQPVKPELVSDEGSFKAGRDGDKPGIIFEASPRKGDAYLEEASLANAEDVTKVLSTTYRFGENPRLDEGVPKALADRFCSGDCVVTKNYSLLEPGLFARKYYARGIGVFLEVEAQSDEVLQLTDCNFDARCANLPQP
jgi:hypothetical protein